MELAALNRKPAAENELNWVTATFMALFHVGAVVALFFFHLEGAARFHVPLVGFGKSGHRYGLSPVAYTSRIQNAQVGGILSDRVRNSGAGRRTNFLGGHTPHPSSAFGRRGRSALSHRRQVVGAHGVDFDREVHASW